VVVPCLPMRRGCRRMPRSAALEVEIVSLVELYPPCSSNSSSSSSSSNSSLGTRLRCHLMPRAAPIAACAREPGHRDVSDGTSLWTALSLPPGRVWLHRRPWSRSLTHPLRRPPSGVFTATAAIVAPWPMKVAVTPHPTCSRNFSAGLRCSTRWCRRKRPQRQCKRQKPRPPQSSATSMWRPKRLCCTCRPQCWWRKEKNRREKETEGRGELIPGSGLNQESN